MANVQRADCFDVVFFTINNFSRIYIPQIYRFIIANRNNKFIVVEKSQGEYTFGMAFQSCEKFPGRDGPDFYCLISTSRCHGGVAIAEDNVVNVTIQRSA